MIVAARLLLQHPELLLRARKYTVRLYVEVKVLEALLVDVPFELVCQYHVIPLGDDPLVKVVDPHDWETDGAEGVDGYVFTGAYLEAALLQVPYVLFLARRYMVRVLVTVYVLEEFPVLVPPELVCQYHVTPLGGFPRVNVLFPQVFDEMDGVLGFAGVGGLETLT